jgi:PKD domain
MKNISSILLALLFLFSFEINGQVPIATFTATPNPVCACSNISFTNSSTNTPTTWTWYFPGGTPSFTTVTTAPGNPGLIIYCTPGFYTISLVVSNSSGSDSVTNTLTVDSLPIITIDPPSGGICDEAGGNAFDTIYFTARASSNSTFSWAPPAGLSCINCPNPRAYPIATTVYTITATSVSGCISTEKIPFARDSPIRSLLRVGLIMYLHLQHMPGVMGKLRLKLLFHLLQLLLILAQLPLVLKIVRALHLLLLIPYAL